MRPISAITEVYGPLRAYPRRRVEKPSGASSLREDARAASRPIIVNDAPARPARASHFETRAGTCEVDGAIPATFIAHVIGQILGDTRPDAVRALRAYAGASRSAP